MADVKVVRFELLGATSAGSAQARVARFELLGSTGGAVNSARVYRFELLGTGTTGTFEQVKVYRFELLGAKGGFMRWVEANGAWDGPWPLYKWSTALADWVLV